MILECWCHGWPQSLQDHERTPSGPPPAHSSAQPPACSTGRRRCRLWPSVKRLWPPPCQRGRRPSDSGRQPSALRPSAKPDRRPRRTGRRPRRTGRARTDHGGVVGHTRSAVGGFTSGLSINSKGFCRPRPKGVGDDVAARLAAGRVITCGFLRRASSAGWRSQAGSRLGSMMTLRPSRWAATLSASAAVASGNLSVTSESRSTLPVTARAMARG
jgi:hypothetical protein